MDRVWRCHGNRKTHTITQILMSQKKRGRGKAAMGHVQMFIIFMFVYNMGTREG